MSDKFGRGDFGLLQTHLQQYGWSLRKCQEEHWQIINAFVKPINLHWKATGHLVVYVNGANKGKGIQPSFSKLVEFIQREEQVCSQVNRRRGTGSQKNILWVNEPHVCRWCQKRLEFDTATIDHLIPRSKGGSDRLDNLCLACHECNQKRKNTMANIAMWDVHLAGGTF